MNKKSSIGHVSHYYLLFEKRKGKKKWDEKADNEIREKARLSHFEKLMEKKMNRFNGWMPKVICHIVIKK